MDARTRIRLTLEALNDVWQSTPPAEVAEKVAPFFSGDAVVVGPGLARLARGRDEIARSYADFTANATLLEVALEPPEVDVSERVAVATLKWKMRYRYHDAETSLTGYDVYVLVPEGERWLIVWRKLESYPAA